MAAPQQARRRRWEACQHALRLHHNPPCHVPPAPHLIHACILIHPCPCRGPGHPAHTPSAPARPAVLGSGTDVLPPMPSCTCSTVSVARSLWPGLCGGTFRRRRRRRHDALHVRLHGNNVRLRRCILRASAQGCILRASAQACQRGAKGGVGVGRHCASADDVGLCERGCSSGCSRSACSTCRAMRSAAPCARPLHVLRGLLIASSLPA